MVMDGTMPYANSLPYSLSYPKSRDAIASKKCRIVRTLVGWVGLKKSFSIKNKTSLDFNYVRPYLVLLQFNFNFMTCLKFKSRH